MSDSVQSATIEGVFVDSISDGSQAAADKLNALGDAVDSVTQRTTRNVPTMASLRKQLDDNAASTNAIIAATARYDAQVAALTVRLEQQQTTQAEFDSLTASAATKRDAAIAKATGTANDNTKATTANAAATKGATAAAGQLTDQHNALGGATAGATREFLVLGHEIVAGNYSRIPGSLIVLGERTNALHSALGYLGDTFSLMGGLALAAGTIAVGALVYMGVAAESAQVKLLSLQNTLRASRDDYTVLASLITASAKDVSRTGGVSSADATEAATLLGGNSQFAGTQTQLEGLVLTARDLATVMGDTVPKAAATLAAAMKDPEAEAKKLSQESFPGFSAQLVYAIKNMQDSGDKAGAFTTVLNTLRAQTDGVHSNLTPLGSALHDLGVAFTEDRDGSQSLGTSLGGALVTGATSAVTAITGILNAMRSVRDELDKMRALGHEMDAENAGRGGTGLASTTPDATGLQVKRNPTPGSTAQGIFQVTDAAATSVGMLGKVGTTDNNIYAGLAYLQQVGSAGAYNQGPGGAISHPAAAAAYTASVNSQNVANLPTDVANQIAYWGQILGMSPDMITLGQKIALQESGGHQYESTGASVAARTGPVNPATIPLGVTTGGGQQYGPDYAGSMRGQYQATANQAFGAYTSSGVLSLRQDKNANDQALLKAGIQQATDAGDTDTVNRLSEALAKAQGEAANLISKQGELARAATDATGPLKAQDGATRDLAVIQQHFAEVARANGEAINQTDLLTVQNAKLVELQAAHDAATGAIERDTAATLAMVPVYQQGATAVENAKNTLTAENEARKTAVTGTDAYNEQVKETTLALNAKAAALSDVSTAALASGQNDQLAQIAAETAGVGQNTDALTKQLAVLKERERIQNLPGGDLNSAASRQSLANVAAIAVASAELTKQKDAMNELANFGESAFNTIGTAITQAFSTGSLKALDFGNILRGVFSEIVQEVLKLAVLNPIIDSLFGDNKVTIGSVGGALGGLLGNTGTGDASAAGGAGLLATLGSYFGVGSASGGAQFDSAGGASGAATGASGAAGLLGSGVSLTTALGGVSILGALGNLAGGKSISLTQGLGVAKTAFDVGSGFFGGASNAVQLAATNTAIGGLGLASDGTALLGPALPGAVASVGGSGSLLGGLGFADGAFSPVTEAINSAAETVAQGVVDAAQGVTGAVTDVVGAVTGSAETIGSATAGAAGLVAGSAVSAVSAYLPAIGAAVSVVSDLVQGNYRGAGLVAAGAAIGTIAGPIGTAVGAAIGGLIDTFLPSHPKNPYESVPVDATGGRLSTGPVVSQLLDPNGAISATQSWVNSVNKFLDQMNLRVNDAGKIGGVGSGVKGDNQVTDPAQLLSRLRFTSNEQTDNLGITEAGDLPGHSFATGADLQAQLLMEAKFADRMTALGLQISGVGVDFQRINIGSVTQTARANDNAIPVGTSITGNASDPNVQNLVADLRTALSHDIVGPQYADEKALDAEIDKVNNFVANTIPSMSAALVQPLSSFQASIGSLVQSYSQAEAQAQSYGLSIDSLTAAQGRNIAQLTDQELNKSGGLNDQFASIAARDLTAKGDTAGAALANFDISAKDQRQTLSQNLVDVFGDAYKTSAGYANNMAQLEQTLADERLAIVQQNSTAIVNAQGQTAAAALAAYTTAQKSVQTVLDGLTTYAVGLQTSSASALSPDSQYALASKQFNAVSGAAAAGDYTSASQLSSYATDFLNTSRAVNGSGAAYAQDYNQVVNAIGDVTGAAQSDALTNSAYIAATQSQTTSLVTAIAGVQAEVAALRAEVAQQALRPARAA